MKENLDTVEEIIQILKNHPGIAKNIKHIELLPEITAKFGEIPDGLSSQLINALNSRGIKKFYSHQTEAISKILEGKNVIIVTPTASGKTLCYNVPVLNEVLKNPEARAVYIFPTKSLSQDQYNEVYELAKLAGGGIKVYTFDGDTPVSARKTIRVAGQIVVTNPDMLHTGILPHHTLWIKLFENLKYIIIDEVHQYRGVFGSHFACVLRRLKRICNFYGARPVFIGCSATIANPRELVEELVEEPFEVVDRSGAPQGKKVFIFYNPPVINPELGIRKSTKSETRKISMQFIWRNIQTIIFARSRLLVEVITTYLKRAMAKSNRNPELIKGYRGGYLPNERREIERGIKEGTVIGVVSTNALELGIDIGQLKVSILSGYPGTIASTWQQGGRAGRKAETSAIILVATSSPLDQFIVNHPEYFFGTSPESGIINPNNLVILSSHLKCAVFELPFEENEFFGKANPFPILKFLSEQYIVRRTEGRFYYSSEKYPAEEISLRNTSVENFVIINASEHNKLIGEVDFDSAPFLIHEDAIYIHQSKTFFIDKLDWERRTAYAREVAVDYYTDAQAKTAIKVITVDNSYEYLKEIEKQKQEIGVSNNLKNFPLISKNLGDLNVSTLVAKYKKIKFETHESVGYGDVHLPENEIQTEGFWLSFREDLKYILEKEDGEIGSALRSLSHLLSNIIPLYVMCDPRDFSSIPMVKSPHSELPTIYIYDKYPGGIGISRNLFFKDIEVLRASKELLDGCRCRYGCPSCCGPEIESKDKGKRSAQLILNWLFETI